MLDIRTKLKIFDMLKEKILEMYSTNSHKYKKSELLTDKEYENLRNFVLNDHESNEIEREFMYQNKSQYYRILGQHFSWFYNFICKERNYSYNFIMGDIESSIKNKEDKNKFSIHAVDLRDFRVRNTKDYFITLEYFEDYFYKNFSKEYERCIKEFQLMREMKNILDDFNKNIYPYTV